ncbi:fluoride efflux transporter CrcB [soil metagenome]
MTAGMVLLVLGAGGLAAVARYGVAVLFGGTRFPFAVLVVNVIGSALGGVVLGLAERAAIDPDWRLVLLTGVAGGLTTFSTWSVESVQLVQEGRRRTTALSVTLNLVLGLTAAIVGYLVTR